MEWISVNLEKVANFFRSHSNLFKKDDRVLPYDALIETAKLYAIILEIKDRKEYGYMDDKFVDGLLTRIAWVYRQLLIDHRINYREYLQLQSKDDNNRFFEVTPNGVLNLNQQVYNIPKHLKKIGVYPDLASGTWIKEIEYDERKWD